MPCGIDWTVEVELPAANTCPGDYTVTYMIEDSCGRRDTCQRIFTIDNVIDLVCRADTTVECWSDLLEAVDRDSAAIAGGEGVTLPCGIDWTVEVELPSANTCPGDYTVTYMIEDSCGRRDTCERIFTIDNAIDLVCRADTTVECWSDLLDAVDRDTTALSNGEGVTMPCGIDWTVEVELPAANTCPGDYTVTYMIEDSCGRRDTCQRIFTIDNAIDLVCRADTTVECWSDLLDAVDRDTTALSNGEGVTMPCGIDWTVEVELPAANTCPGDYTVTYIIEDSCGRRDTCERIFTIDNAIDLVCRADTTVECWSDLLDAVDRDTTALSNGEGVTMPCGIDWTVEVELPSANTCPGDYTVTYMIEDSCGRRDTCQRIFTIDNAIDLVCRADTTVECWSDLLDAVDRDSTAIAGGEGVTMPCGIDWTVEVELPAANTCPGDYTVIYMIEDSCGRRDTCERIFTIDNAIDLVCRADTTVECWSDLLDAVDRDSAAIVNGEGVTVPCGIEWSVEVELPAANTCPGDYTVIYMIEDSCGRRDTCERLFTIDGSFDFECSLVQSQTVTCWEDLLNQIAADSNVLATSTTNSCGVEHSIRVEIPTASSCPGVYQVLYIAEDSCSRTDTCVVDYLLDNPGPEIICPLDTVVDCGTDIDTSLMGSASGTSSCQIPFTIDYRDSLVNGSCGSNYVVYRIWSIIDTCQRQAECIQTITVQDTSLPVITCPEDVLIDCEGSTDTTDTGVATATDNCGPAPSISYVDSIENTACAGNYIIYRIWTAVDECLNESSCIQTITVQDTSLPVITCPEDVLIDCEGSTDTTDTGVATATDNCGPAPVISYIDSIENTACGGNYIIYRIWTAVDECLNESSCIQTITVQDTSLPVITCPEDVVIDCEGSTDTTDTGVATATDNCGPTPEISYIDSIENTACGGNYIIYRIWTAVDECLNESSCIQTITVQDTSLPVITCPEDVVIDCEGSTDTTDTGVATATDNCGPTPEISYIDSIENTACGGNYIIYRIWTAVDECLNERSCIQTITVQDTSLPVITCPEDVVIDCEGSTDTTDTGVATATDNCGPAPVISYIDSIENTACGGNYIIYRIWTAVDECLNESSCIQTITVQDTSLPVITCPEDTTVACDASTDTTDLGIATATDNCGPTPEITFVDSLVAGTCGTSSTIYRIWNAEDECGNVSSCIQVIVIEDLTAPILENIPADTIVECGGTPPAPVTGVEILAPDNCGTSTIEFAEDTIPGQCENEYVIRRMWTAIDECQNEFRDTQLITVTGCTPDVTIEISPNPACLDEDVTFTATITGGYANPVFQWQMYNGSNWVDVPGATTVPYTINGVQLTDGGQYRLVMADQSGNLTNFDCNVVSDTLELIINSPMYTTIDDELCDGGTYVFNDTTITTAGTYVDSLLTSQGCDSVVTLNLSILDVLTTDLVESICDIETYQFGDETLSSTGIYVDTLISDNGCDSIVTLDLTVHPTYSVTVNDTICEGETYDFLGTPLTESDTYFDTLQTVNGCDSAITLELVVNPIVTYVFNDVICAGTPYTFGSMSLDSSDTYVDTLQSGTGCDSIVTLNLTVNPVYDQSFDEEICDGGSFTFADTTLTTAGTYTKILQTSDGCDSIVTVNLVVLDILTETLVDSICEGASYPFNGNNYDSSGTYTFTTISSLGCDSIVTLELTVMPTYDIVIVDTICEGETYDFNEHSATTTGTYTSNLSTAFGCDSIVTLDLLVNPIVTHEFDDEICEGTPYTFGSHSPDSTDTYIDTLVSSTGCDSIVTLNLVVHPVYNHTFDEQICDGDTYLFADTTLTTSGTYTKSLTSVNGCDSTVTINLNVLEILTELVQDTICAGGSMSFNGSTYDTTGSYSYTMLSSIGCDSVVTLDLMVMPVYDIVLYDTICEGETYQFNEHSATTTGTYVSNLTTQYGCDSIVTLDLLVNPIVTHEFDDEICEGTPYTFGSESLDSSGTYVDTLESATGCDSIVTLNLTVHPVYDHTFDEQICDGTGYTFGDTSLTTSGTYVKTFASVEGCDSTVTINLLVLDILRDTIREEICDGESLSWNNGTYTTSDTVEYTTTSSIGCDSIVTLELTVNPVYDIQIVDTICEGDTVEFNEHSATSTGTYVSNLTTVDGCDSIVTLDLFVRPTSTYTYDDEICDGETYPFNDTTLATSGTYMTTVATAYGCDSVVTVNLTVNPIYNDTLDESICDGTSYDFAGDPLTSDGTYTKSFMTLAGCDSIVTINLSVLDILRDTVRQEICDGESFPWNGDTYTATGTAEFTTTSSIGCDSIVTLDLTVNPVYDIQVVDTICEGDTVEFNEHSATSTGTYVSNLTTVDGCDSIVTLDLFVRPTSTYTYDDEICDGETYPFNDTTLATSGTYVTTVSTAHGCDSVVTVNLTVNPIYNDTLDESICDGTSYDFAGDTLTSDGTYTKSFTTTAGCDSTVTINLTVLDILRDTVRQEICDGESFPWNGDTYTTTGTAEFTTTSSIGCDSIVTLELTVNPVYNNQVVDTICEGDTYEFNEHSATSTGTYVSNLTSVDGCDSIVTLDLFVRPTSTYTYDDEICDGETYPFNDTTLATGGTYVTTVSTAHGCDSIVTVNLTVNPIYNDTLDESICDGTSYDFAGDPLTTDGTYTKSFTTTAGCDSTVTINLTVLDILRDTVRQEICDGESFPWNGDTYTTTGTAEFTTTSSIGCDSIVTLELTVNPVYDIQLQDTICEGDTYEFNEHSATTSGIYVSNLSTLAGCDSVVTLDLFVRPTSTYTYDHEICDGETYPFNDTTLATSGTYVTTVNTAHGCDSIVTVNLTVHPVYNDTLDQSICEGTSYTFGSDELTVSDTYTKTFTSVNGCDSVVTINLTVLEILEETVLDSICEGESLTWNGVSYNTAGSYDYTTTSSIGCDSIVTLELTVNPVYDIQLQDTICEGDTYEFNEHSATTSGIYVSNLSTVAGCDSIVTLDLFVRPTQTYTYDHEICNGEIYTFNDTTLATSGTYVTTVTTAHGCDSIVTVNLTVNPVYDITLDESICDGTSYTFGGDELTVSDTYTKTFTTVNGCDSVVTINLTVLEILEETVLDSICEGESLTWNGVSYSAAGSYEFTTTSSIGCDSIATLELTVNPVYDIQLQDTICEGETFDFNEHSATTSGVYVSSLTTVDGCDSIVTLDLFVRPTQTYTYDDEICEGDIYTFNDTTLATSGTYVTMVTTAHGCDSIVTVNLTVNPVYDITLDESICDGTSYTFGGDELTVSDTYTKTFTTVNGCDSVVTINLTVLEILEETVLDSICEGESLTWNGVSYNTAGSYEFTTTSSIGCDSIVTLELTVNPVYDIQLQDTICEGDTYEFNEHSATTSGIYVSNLSTVAGCDSIVTLDLFVRPTQTYTYDHEICDGEFYTFNDTTLATSGTYVTTVNTAHGCDSIVTVNLTVHPVYNDTLDQSICEGTSYTFGSDELTASDTYTKTFTSVNGCDSVVTINLTVLEILEETVNLTVHPVYNDTLDQSICEGTSYTFGSDELTASDTYTKTFTSVNGCDSVVTINLTVLEILEETVLDSICEGESLTWNGVSYNTAGSYDYTTTSSIGCDSIVTLELTVNPVYDIQLQDTICEGDTYEFNEHSATTSGIYVSNLSTVAGCDSIVTLDLFVRPTQTYTYDHEICDGEFYTFNDTTLATSGTYVTTVTTAHGCDSIVTVNLTVNPVYDITLDESICDGTSYTFGSDELTVSDTYTKTFTSVNGCDSVVTINLTVLEILEETVLDSICEGETLTWNNVSYSTAGSYEYTTTSSIGCDSIVTLELTVNPVYDIQLQDTICEGDTYEFNEHSVTTSGIYVSNLSTVAGCDSTVTLDLFVRPTQTYTYDDEICDGETYPFNDTTLATSGTYVTTVNTAHGCDSIVTVNLTVHPVYNDTLDQSICEGTSYTFGSDELTVSDTYTKTFTSVNGCDSVVTINLTVLEILEETVLDSICEGETLTWNNVSYSTAGSYEYTTTSSIGCDSIVTLELTVNPVYDIQLQDTICEGDTYEFNEHSVTTSGIYVSNLSTVAGCDSTVTLDLFVRPTQTYTYDDEICDGETYPFNDTTLATSGTYVTTVNTAHGCDSIVTVNLTVHPVYNDTLDQSICEGTSYTFGSDELTVSDTYTKTFTSVNGCDSVVTINLTVLEILEETVFDTICEGGVYQFKDMDLLVSGSYDFTTTSSIGCDSIVTLELTVLPINRETIQEHICQGDVYDFHGNLLSQTGTYNEIVAGTNGCDSIVTLELFVHPVKSTDLTEEICEGDSYHFNGRNLDSSDVYVDTLLTIHGCDSIVTLDLTVHPVYDIVIDETICEGDSYDFAGEALMATDAYTKTFTTVNGCDSTVTINLTVLEILRETVLDSICEGETFPFNGSDYTASGSYDYTTISSIGCDSVVTLELTVLPIERETIQEAICEGDEFDFNGNLLSQAGTYEDIVQGSNGCDSVVTLILSVNPVERTSLTDAICEGDVYPFNGRNLDSTDIYVDTLLTIHGCDSIVTLDLTVHPVYDIVIDETICEGDSYDFAGEALTATDAYTKTFTTVNGCDSIVTINLTVLEILRETVLDSICEGETYPFNGTDYTESGSYEFTTVSSINCDSVVTLELTVLPVNTEDITEEICEGEIFEFNDQILDTPGDYQAIVQGVNGCDSIVNLTLIVHHIESSTVTEEICEGESFTFLGIERDSTGTYVDTLSSIYGCDSIVTLNLTVHPVYQETIDEVICDEHSYTFNGEEYTESGTYTDTLQTINGCDSIRTLNLTVLPILTEEVNEEICDGDTLLFNGQLLTTSGNYTDTLLSSIGCDSIVYLTLAVHEIRYTELAEEICQGEFFVFHGDTLTESGTYPDTLTSVTGCDSIVSLDLVVHPTYHTPLTYEICEYDSITIAGKDYHDAGDYLDTLQTIDGCDSILGISIIELETRYEEITASICDDATYLFASEELSEAGIYVDTLTSSLGCDSIVTLTLDVMPVQRHEFVKQICVGQSFDFNGRLLTATGIYVDTVQASNGCDSIVTIDFRVVDEIQVTFDEIVCENDSIAFNNEYYSMAGSYRDTLTSAGGCDSIITINIEIAPVAKTELHESICEGEEFDFLGTVLSDSGEYADTLTTTFGCDSVITLHLTVIPTEHDYLTEVICEGDSILVADTVITTAGKYDIVRASISSGCSQVTHLDLTVTPIERTTDTVHICEGETYTFHGVTYDSTGVYVDTLQASTGCDSLSGLDLRVRPLPFSTVVHNICTGETVEIGGVTYSDDTTFTEVYLGAFGCDSSVTYVVTVLPDVEIFVPDASICPGEEVQLQVEVTGTDSLVDVTWFPADGLSCTDCMDPIASPSETTIYTISTVGCGGVMIDTSMTVEVVPMPGLTVSEDQLVDLGQTVTLQAINETVTIPIDWYDEETGELLCTDCPNLVIQPDAAGEYKYIASAVNSLGCGEQDTVMVTVVDPCEVERIVAENAFTPNGDGFNDQFEIRNDGISTIGLIQIFNRWGEIVFETTDLGIQWDGTFRGDPVNPGVYMYIIQADCVNGSTFQLAGNVTVIR